MIRICGMKMLTKMKTVTISLFALMITCFSCSHHPKSYRQSISLGGNWQFALDTAYVGESQEWYLTDLPDAVQLPGTTDSNKKGFLTKDTTTLHLTRLYHYEGAAWYRRLVEIPASFQDKHIQLSLERTKVTAVWIDSVKVGQSALLQAPQEFNVSEYLTPGTHYITIRVDNRTGITPYGMSHIYSDDTQTNWNGIIGDIFLEATETTYISNLQVFPDVANKQVNVQLEVINPQHLDSLGVALQIEKNVAGAITPLPAKTTRVVCARYMTITYELGDDCALWDEFEQPLYHLTAVISHAGGEDAKTVPFGMRKLAVKGTQFVINGRTTFLRGKHEAAVFPLTGYTPTAVEDWVRVFRIAKSYGINHYRFHSYCPPEAAFTAADQEGIYLQAELPFWGGLESHTVADMLRTEGFAMLKAYGNHPSFVMFSAGNEIWSGHDLVEKNMRAFKKVDGRALYAMGSNNGIGYEPPRPYADFFVAARIPYAYDTTLTHTRLTHAFADSRDGGLLNTQVPNTEVNFNYAVQHMNIPIVSHEVGQYQTYPDYHEIDKYTGVLKPWNLEVFKQRLARAGMANQDSAFHQASGVWAAICYKAEMEAAIRTRGFGGFQLLDLQDFPGQGTALVGILDAFMDSKGVVTPEVWRESCNDVVLLLEFPKYCWTTRESFRAKVVVANYGKATLEEAFTWAVKNAQGEVVQQGTFPTLTLKQGILTAVGNLQVDLKNITRAEKWMVHVALPGTDYHNTYPIWVYPAGPVMAQPDDVVITDQLNDQVMQQLTTGANVLLFPRAEAVQNHSIPGLFPPDFWNYGMFKSISESNHRPVSPGTLGLLTDPHHPLFNDFPTDYHTHWQWFSIIKASRALILDQTPKTYRPIVQMIDNLERNHKLGLVFEWQVGQGKLLVCMAPLDEMPDTPEAVQLYQSIIKYMTSDDFAPVDKLDHQQLMTLQGR